MTWSNWGVPGVLAFVAACAAAAVAFKTAPGRPLNRRLTGLLLVEAVFIGFTTGFILFVGSERAAFWTGALGVAAMTAQPFQYLRFLGISLETPLVAPFRGRFSSAALLWLVGAAFLLVLFFPHSFVGQPYSPGFAAWNFQPVDRGILSAQLFGIAGLFGFVAAIHAYLRTTPGSAARDRAKWFAIAFGARDAYFGVMLSLYAVIRPIEFWGDFVYNSGAALMYLVYMAFLSYGVLRTQLFDLDLKIKIAFKWSTVASVIAGAFFIGSEILESVIPVEGTLLGLVSAGLVVVALRPVQKVSEKVVGRLMPGVDPTPTYISRRKTEVYSAAYEVALRDGIVTEVERAILEELRVQLSITEPEAESVEEAVRARPAG